MTGDSEDTLLDPRLSKLLDWGFAPRQEIKINGYITRGEVLFRAGRDLEVDQMSMIFSLGVGCPTEDERKFIRRKTGQRMRIQRFKWKYIHLDCPKGLDYSGPVDFELYKHTRNILLQGWWQHCWRLRHIEEAWAWHA